MLVLMRGREDQSGPEREGGEILFFDAHCRLCRAVVRLVESHDARGLEPPSFRVAPLDSEIFRSAVPEPARTRLPDSVVVRTADGRLLTRSVAVAHVLARLGRFGRLSSRLLRLLPIEVGDRVYDLVARLRRLLPPASPR